MSKTYFLDLFAGIGGFALGAEWAGGADCLAILGQENARKRWGGKQSQI